ncbi:MAG TPA: hypothetical protein VL475_09210 [Planctomycetaceae bacterium]|nr:hypothetical protein [Planctomycetaceae bacterium]
MIIDDRFASLLSGFDLAALEADPGVIYAVDHDLRLSYINPAWFRFAAENGGEPQISREWALGRFIMDAIAEELRPFFAKHFRRSLDEMRPWQHVYECSSATRFRKHRMNAFPLEEGQGLLLSHALVLDEPMSRDSAEPDERRFRNPQGIIRQCAHCRRVEQQPPHAGWAWVPEWMARCPPQTSHGICPPCFGFYFSERQLSAAELPRPIVTEGTSRAH